MAEKMQPQGQEKVPDRSKEEWSRLWLDIATKTPTERLVLPPKKGAEHPLHIIVERRNVNDTRVGYLVFIDRNVAHQKDMKVEFDEWQDPNQIGHFYCLPISPSSGKTTVARARVYNPDLRRRGIADALYNLIEKDIRSIGGLGIEPDTGELSDDGVEFWKNRLPDEGDRIEARNESIRKSKLT